MWTAHFIYLILNLGFKECNEVYYIQGAFISQTLDDAKINVLNGCLEFTDSHLEQYSSMDIDSGWMIYNITGINNNVITMRYQDFKMIHCQ